MTAISPEHDMSATSVSFLHVSDIHFTVHTAPVSMDIDQGIRQRMLEAVESLVAQVGAVDMILAVGDIAFSGKPDQYARAEEWLNQAARAAGCPNDRVVCVPGNHDIDRSSQTPLHDSLRWHLRHCATSRVSDHLQHCLEHPTDGASAFAPLAAYNAFALRYDCHIGPGRPLLRPRDLPLGERVVRIHPLTSAWLCDATDDHSDDARRVVLGLFQLATIGADRDVVTVTLCHHPLRWLRDERDAGGWLSRAHVRLFGHEHASGIEVAANTRSVTVNSGAVTPPRDEDGWYPTFNLIRLSTPQHDRLRVEIWARSWDVSRSEFRPDPAVEDPHVLELILDPVAPRPVLPVPQAPPPSPPEPAITDARRLVYEIIRASPERRYWAAKQLNLVEAASPGPVADREMIDLAQARGVLSALHKRVTDV